MYQIVLRIVGWTFMIAAWVVACGSGDVSISEAVTFGTVMICAAIMIK